MSSMAVGGVTNFKLRYLRGIMEGNSQNLTIFATYLQNMKHWDGFAVDPWEANDSMKHLKGRHTKEFVRNTASAVSLLQRLMPSAQIDNFCKCLVSFKLICTILGMVIINQYEEGNDVINQGISRLSELLNQ